VTPASGTSPNVRAQLGYGPLARNPQWESGWQWSNATYQGDVGAKYDEFVGAFTAPPGTWGYAYRVSLDQGVSWTYCDRGAGSDVPSLTFDFADLAVVTILP
jgi:hypothetical protein